MELGLERRILNPESQGDLTGGWGHKKGDKSILPKKGGINPSFPKKGGINPSSLKKGGINPSFPKKQHLRTKSKSLQRWIWSKRGTVRKEGLKPVAVPGDFVILL